MIVYRFAVLILGGCIFPKLVISEAQSSNHANKKSLINYSLSPPPKTFIEDWQGYRIQGSPKLVWLLLFLLWECEILFLSLLIIERDFGRCLILAAFLGKCIKLDNLLPWKRKTVLETLAESHLRCKQITHIFCHIKNFLLKAWQQ